MSLSNNAVRNRKRTNQKEIKIKYFLNLLLEKGLTLQKLFLLKNEKGVQ